jgi:hypothetical protein
MSSACSGFFSDLCTAAVHQTILPQAALRYMVYGKAGIFDADRLIDLLNAFESFAVAAQSSRGDMDSQSTVTAAPVGAVAAAAPWGVPQLLPQLPLPLPGAAGAFGDGAAVAAMAPAGIGLFGLPANTFDLRQRTTLDSQGRLREALRCAVAAVAAAAAAAATTAATPSSHLLSPFCVFPAYKCCLLHCAAAYVDCCECAFACCY